MKWATRLKALGNSRSEDSENVRVSITGTDENCQKHISSVFGISDLEPILKSEPDSIVESSESLIDTLVIREERIAIMMFDGGLSEKEAIEFLDAQD